MCKLLNIHEVTHLPFHDITTSLKSESPFGLTTFKSRDSHENRTAHEGVLNHFIHARSPKARSLWQWTVNLIKPLKGVESLCNPCIEIFNKLINNSQTINKQPSLKQHKDMSLLKGLVHTKIIILSLITHPHVVPNPFIFRTQIKMFLIKSEISQTLHRQQHNWNVPSYRNVINTSVKQSMWHQWLNFSLAMVQEYFFFCTKKTKITIYSTTLLPRVKSSAIVEYLRTYFM